MLKKTVFYLVLLAVGILLVICGAALGTAVPRQLTGILLGAGAGLFGMSTAKLIIIYVEKKNPSVEKQNRIEWKDERNSAIRSKAKARAADITQWFLILLAFLTILADAPLWMTLTAVGIYLLYHVLSMYLMGKYQKEM